MIYLDSNVWLYALMATEDNAKRKRAIELIESQPIVISFKVINEVSRVLLKKGGLSEEYIRSLLQGFYLRYPMVYIDWNDIIRTSNLRERYRLSFWDGFHVAAPLKTGATILFSEDMDTGLIVDDVLKIMNPFHDL